MRPSVVAVLPAFQARYEGTVTWPYLDIKGLVTVGIGCLIDPISTALGLAWELPDGTAASPEQVDVGWRAVKTAAYLAHAGYRAAEEVSGLRLSQASIDALVLQRAGWDEVALRGRFANWDALPGNAQLGCMSIAWAAGSIGFTRGFPRCCAAIASGDWATAAAESRLDATGNPGLVPRNAATAKLFAACLDPGDPATVYGWP